MNSLLCVEMSIAPVVASFCSTERLRKDTSSVIPQIVHYLLKKSANVQAIAEIDPIILRYTQSGSISSMQYADVLHDKSCNVVDVYGEFILNDISMEGVASSIGHSLKD